MRRRSVRQGIVGFAVCAVLLTLAMVPLTAEGASSFASPAFRAQWNSVETVIPNFWGPLPTARDGQVEPYVEGVYNGQPGSRLVQYFDKARMEQTTPNSNVSNGLLTVELKTGQLQLGDNAFQALAPANIGVAGDPGSPGPTYATLGLLPEREPQANGSVALTYDVATGQYTRGAVSSDPNAAFATYLGDPNNRFGQNVPKAFADFLTRIPGGYLGAMGFPITPAFQATITLNGKAGVPVIVQAFQRKVLTYTPSNEAAFQVEFGNIGQHYYAWRSLQGNLPTPTPGATTTATATATVTVTVTAIGTATATTTPVVVTATPTATTAPTQTAVVITASPVPTTAVPPTAPIATTPVSTPATNTPIPGAPTRPAATTAP